MFAACVALVMAFLVGYTVGDIVGYRRGERVWMAISDRWRANAEEALAAVRRHVE
jgi:ABC-type dipeptide/oligopeptide/nickel transport system permease subunit